MHRGCPSVRLQALGFGWGSSSESDIGGGEGLMALADPPRCCPRLTPSILLELQCDAEMHRRRYCLFAPVQRYRQYCYLFFAIVSFLVKCRLEGPVAVVLRAHSPEPHAPTMQYHCGHCSTSVLYKTYNLEVLRTPELYGDADTCFGISTASWWHVVQGLLLRGLGACLTAGDRLRVISRVVLPSTPWNGCMSDVAQQRGKSR